jgi:CheY-like chemotaxis protein
MCGHVETQTKRGLILALGGTVISVLQQPYVQAAERVAVDRDPGWLLMPIVVVVSVLALVIVAKRLRHETARRAEAERALSTVVAEGRRAGEVRAGVKLREDATPSAERTAAARSDRRASWSHELRTPLNAIVGWAAILKIDNGANRERAIEAIERNAFIESRLISELLETPDTPAMAAAEPAASDQSERRRPATPGDAGAPDAHLRILIVEDNDDAAASLSVLLEQRGCEVQVAHSVQEGVKAFAEARPDVLLCDIGLPDGDGCTLLRLVRSQSAVGTVPAIALSAAAREEDRERATAAGFAFYMTKPYRIDELFGNVRRVAAGV